MLVGSYQDNCHGSIPGGVPFRVNALGGQVLHGAVGSGRNDGSQEEAAHLEEHQDHDQVGQLPGAHDLDDGPRRHVGQALRMLDRRCLKKICPDQLVCTFVDKSNNQVEQLQTLNGKGWPQTDQCLRLIRLSSTKKKAESRTEPPDCRDVHHFGDRDRITLGQSHLLLS